MRGGKSGKSNWVAREKGAMACQCLGHHPSAVVKTVSNGAACLIFTTTIPHRCYDGRSPSRASTVGQWV